MRNFKGTCAALTAALLACSATAPALAQVDDAAEETATQVSAKAWIVVDNPSGKVVAQQNAGERVKVGGFPKLMTALLVARLAAADPKLLDERIEFEPYMVKVPGTKTGAAAGDGMTVRDALYGLLVGSANDAALALSQRFNDSFAESNFRQLAKIPARSRSFIAEMNREARKLGMKDTMFRSSYIDGGDKDERTSSAHDLARLSIAVMADPLLREIVGAKSHSAKIAGADGTTRNRSWNNANRLLGSGGVGGILTTGTPASGQSVILATTAGGRSRIVVVLGSDTPSQRFADARTIAASVN